MSRYIDADALKKRVEDSNKSAGLHLEDLRKIRRWINTAPSLDLVRCEDCKYKRQCRKAVEHITHEPTSVTIGYKSINFCSYGEKEEE